MLKNDFLHYVANLLKKYIKIVSIGLFISVLLNIAIVITPYMTKRLIAYISSNFIANIRSKLFHKILKAPLSFFIKLPLELLFLAWLTIVIYLTSS